MNKISFIMENSIDVSEFKKTIGFISEKIVSYSINGNVLEIEIEDEYHKDILIKEVEQAMKQYVSTSSKESTIYENHIDDKVYSDEPKDVHFFHNGAVGFEKKALFLYRYFEQSFNSIAHAIEPNNCFEKLYPVLIDIEHYQKTGYLKNSPQYAMFCCSACENINKLSSLNDYIANREFESFLINPKFALSPSACFHSYCEYEDKVIADKQIVTFTQSVFRNEGRFNFSEFGRLLDYHVKEIVFFGDQEYIFDMTNKAIQKVIELISRWDLKGKITTASDSFVIPKLQKFKKIQLLEANKYELRLNYNTNQMLSVASFNIHGTAFTEPFNIEIKNCDNAVTGCIGFGLERWVLVFLKQYGENVGNWPRDIKEAFNNE